MAVYEGNLLNFGGGTRTSSTVKRVSKWNSGSSWTTMSSMALPKNCSNAGNPLVIDNEIHIFGLNNGTASADPTNLHYKWNGSAWEYVETVPFSISHARTRFLYNDGVIHAIGYSTSAKQHWINDGTGWTNVSDLLPVITRGNSAVVYKGELHLISPYGDTDGDYVWNGNGWDFVGNVSALSITDGSVMVEMEGAVHLFMGENSSNYKLVNNTWTAIDSKPRGIYSNGWAVYQGRFHAYGYGSGDQHLVW